MRLRIKILVAAGIGMLAAGCSPQQEASVTNTVNNAASEVANSAERVGGEIQNKAQPMVNEASRAVDNGAVTLRVKTAFQASAQLEASGIKVSTNNSVTTLSGTVPDAKQHHLALTIAKSTVGTGIKVIDRIKVVGPAATPTSSGY